MIDKKSSRETSPLKDKCISLEAIAKAMLEAAIAGGRALLAAPFDASALKSDSSPVTPADLASDAAIQNILSDRFPNIRSVSEENIGSFSDEDATKPFFLIDPLDGTKEYIANKTDFAVCIGYVINQRPVAGVILAPKLRKAWLAAGEAMVFDLDTSLEKITSTVRPLRILETKTAASPLRIITSRSHIDPRALTLIARYQGAQHQTLGSAVKFTALAEGEADLYPRGTGSMEWDTAAGEALVIAAGGAMLGGNGKPLVYGQWKNGFRNEAFIVASNDKLLAESLSQWEAC